MTLEAEVVLRPSMEFRYADWPLAIPQPAALGVARCKCSGPLFMCARTYMRSPVFCPECSRACCDKDLKPLFDYWGGPFFEPRRRLLGRARYRARWGASALKWRIINRARRLA